MKIIILGASSYLAQKFLNKLYEQPDIEIICFYRDKISDVRKNKHYPVQKFQDFKKYITDDTIMCNFICNYGRNNEIFEEIEYANYTLPLKFYRELSYTLGSIFLNCGTVLPDNYNNYSLTKNKLYQKILSDTEPNCRFLEISLQSIYGTQGKNGSFVDRVLNACVQNLPHFKIITPKQKREFIHITDVIMALYIIVTSIRAFSEKVEKIDIGSERQYFLENISSIIKQETRSKTEFLLGYGDIYKIPGSDLRKLRELGWEERQSLRKYVREAIG